MQCNVMYQPGYGHDRSHVITTFSLIMQNYSLNLKLCQYQVCLVYEILPLNYSAFLMTTYNYIEGSFEQIIGKGSNK